MLVLSLRRRASVLLFNSAQRTNPSHSHRSLKMDAVGNGWFTELSTMWPGQGLSIKIKEMLHQRKSDFQDIMVFESEAFGTVMTLDGVIQVTDRDEFAYQEMMAHLPTCGLNRPAKKALVIGGGDGGVLRELGRHTSFEEIQIAEIDGAVIETSKAYFPEMAVGFDDPRVKVHIGDGLKFLKDTPDDTYDVIIVDSSDPVGPAEVLFQRPFFEDLHRVLKRGGCVCTQAESLWLHLDIIQALAKMCSEVFQGGSIAYAFTTIPTYPSGQIGFMMCSKGEKVDFRIPKQPLDSTPPAGSKLRPLQYYTAEAHRAAFVLPKFAETALQEYLTRDE